MITVKTDKDKIDVKQMDKDELYNRFERAIVRKNQADEYIKTTLEIIKKELRLNGDESNDKRWISLIETLGYPYHTKCIKNEPMISVHDDEANHNYWISGDIICIDSDANYPNIQTRMRMNFGAFDIDNDFELINIIISNVAIIERWLDEYRQSTRDYIDKWYHDLAIEEITFWTSILNNIDQLKNGKLFGQIICIDNHDDEEDK